MEWSWNVHAYQTWQYLCAHQRDLIRGEERTRSKTAHRSCLALADPFLSACGDLKEMENGEKEKKKKKENLSSFNGKRVISYRDAIKGGEQCGFAQLSE